MDAEKTIFQPSKIRDQMRYLIPVIVILMLYGCKTQYIPVVESHTEYINRTDTVERVDSVISEKTTIIMELDSVTMAEYGIQLQGMQKAWLVEKNSLQRALSEFREIKTDTVIERDTTTVEVKVNELTKWQTFQCNSWFILLLFLFFIIRFKV